MLKPQEEKDVVESFAAIERYHRKRALKQLFRFYFGCEDYNFFINAFMWVKCLVCLLLNRTGGTYHDYNSTCVMSYDEEYGYESMSWRSCWVTPALFSGWQVCLASDGT